MSQAYEWTCGEQVPTSVAPFQGSMTVEAVARKHLPRSRGALGAISVRPQIVLVCDPSLKLGKVLIMSAPGAAAGEHIERLLGLSTHPISPADAQAAFLEFQKRLGVGNRLASARSSAVDAVFRIRLEQCAPNVALSSESDDESYVESSEESGSSEDTELEAENEP